MLSTQLPNLIRKNDFFKQNTLKAIIEMVTTLNINSGISEWESDISE